METRDEDDSSLSVEERVRTRAQNRCERCWVDFDRDFRGELHYIVPVEEEGGNNNPENFSLLCPGCKREAPTVESEKELFYYYNYYLRFASFKEAATHLGASTRKELQQLVEDSFVRESFRKKAEQKKPGQSQVDTKKWIARAPFGYSVEEENGVKRLVLVPEEAKVVTLIFKKKAEGLSDYQLTRFLQQGCAEGKNWRTKTGKHWTAVQVKRVWQNPLYTGNIKVKDKKNKGEYRILLGNHQGIVSEEEFLGLNLGMKGLFSEEKA